MYKYLILYFIFLLLSSYAHAEAAAGGGFGGNLKIGKYIYDNQPDHFPSFLIERDPATGKCYYKNKNILIKRCNKFSPIWGCLEEIEAPPYDCPLPDSTHLSLYWNSDSDAINGGYSPSNDVLVNGEMIRNLYLDWVGLPVLINQNHTPMILTMIVHQDMGNAYWNGRTMNFGDGNEDYYPFTTLDVTAHEISHGFTEQHSNLHYYGQSGGINESFSDIAGKSAEYYANHFIDWTLGSGVIKEENSAFRYMDQPSKDCHGMSQPGYNCSIDDANQYHNSLDEHQSSGVYNHFFYLLSTTPNWDIKKTFQIIAQANAYYWTSSSNYQQAACDILSATHDYGYNEQDVKAAFEAIKIDTESC